MYGQTPSGKPNKDTTSSNSGEMVKYQVLQQTFVNGRIERPENDDGSPNFVMAAPGLESAALKRVGDQADIERAADRVDAAAALGKAETDASAAEKSAADRIAAAAAAAEKAEADASAAEKSAADRIAAAAAAAEKAEADASAAEKAAADRIAAARTPRGK